ncbi:WGxxGxxG family protein [Mycobacterium sp. TY815]|uniref:WGxxGxxG family protein n=1 Tax=Mycobacterium sp. TY815 TaxID=3050581 RepID=UPI000FC148A0|nr:WGxxGxxG family protein [Mycobacterium sp. TY815]MDP7704047.1 WGxxGxxG family protein [Mycobacterium sp. TY815]RUP02056.1 MAG: LPXTG cell wall anchor domain-containing protein [Mycobacterium sp.]
MRNTIAAGCAATALLFGGAGVANAAVDQAPVPSATTTTLADTDNTNQHSDNTGLWGLAGLLGLAGLAGLKRRNTTDAAIQPTATPRPPA